MRDVSLLDGEPEIGNLCARSAESGRWCEPELRRNLGPATRIGRLAVRQAIMLHAAGQTIAER
jgi:hypothetical protein